MNRASHANQGTTQVRPAYRFNEAALTAWMEAHVEGFRGPLIIEQFKGGLSNPTYKLISGNRAYVLRRKPPGLLLKGAHAIDREARVLTAPGTAQFPVPKVYGLCTDESVLGTSFYVMELVEGRIFWDATLPEVARTDRPAYFDAMNETVARLHRIDYRRVGLSDYGKPGDFQRQIARWTKQYLEDPEAGGDPNMDWLIEWLPAAVPPSGETTLVHGDWRVDNLIFHPIEPRVVAVLD